MPQKTIYDQIKKQNGERFARAVRKLGLLDIQDLPWRVKYAGSDPVPLGSYFRSLKQLKYDRSGPVQSPFELLRQAGYRSFYADTLEKQNAIAGYFEKAICSICKAEYGDYVQDQTMPTGEVKIQGRSFWQTFWYTIR